MNTTRYWYKEDPTVTAEVFDDFDTDDQGGVPAIIDSVDDEGINQRLYALIRLSEWSSEELKFAPNHVPTSGYLVIYGQNEEVAYQFVTSEYSALKSLHGGAVGYVPVTVNTKAMVC